MGNWFPKKGRGLIFGLWTCHQYIGDIVAALATAAIINAGFHWQYALLLPGVLNGITGIANFMFLPNDPSEVGLDPVEKKAPGAAGAPAGGGSIGFMQALKIPNVMGYALAFGFFKFINYAMFFWLPFFLSVRDAPPPPPRPCPAPRPFAPALRPVPVPARALTRPRPLAPSPSHPLTPTLSSRSSTSTARAPTSSPRSTRSA